MEWIFLLLIFYEDHFCLSMRARRHSTAEGVGVRAGARAGLVRRPPVAVLADDRVLWLGRR